MFRTPHRRAQHPDVMAEESDKCSFLHAQEEENETGFGEHITSGCSAFLSFIKNPIPISIMSSSLIF